MYRPAGDSVTWWHEKNTSPIFFLTHFLLGDSVTRWHDKNTSPIFFSNPILSVTWWNGKNTSPIFFIHQDIFLNTVQNLKLFYEKSKLGIKWFRLCHLWFDDLNIWFRWLDDALKSIFVSVFFWWLGMERLLEEASTWKVTKGELWISAHSESAGDLLSDGLPEPPPTLIGLICKEPYIMVLNDKKNRKIF